MLCNSFVIDSVDLTQDKKNTKVTKKSEPIYNNIGFYEHLLSVYILTRAVFKRGEYVILIVELLVRGGRP